MAFFDKLSSMAKTAMDKTSEMIEVGSLNSKISAERGKIAELKQKIGEYYWQRYLNNGALDAEPAASCEEIKAHEEAITAIQAEIQAKKEAAAQAAEAPVMQATAPAAAGGLTCGACGCANAEGTKFCQSCGAKLEAPAAGDVCSCGAKIPASSKFCPECGKPAPRPETKVICACGAEIPQASRFCPECGAAAVREGDET